MLDIICNQKRKTDTDRSAHFNMEISTRQTQNDLGCQLSILTTSRPTVGPVFFVAMSSFHRPGNKHQKTGGFGIDLVLGSPMVPLNRSITPQAPQDLTLERPELEKLLRGNMWKLCKIVFIVMEREADLISFVRPEIFVIIKNMSEKLNQPAALPMADTPP